MRVRFAPSPTGHLHLGNLRIALYNYLFARKHGGAFILRIDDTGPDASEEYEKAIEEDLLWLGIKWDEKRKQSQRIPLYQQFFDRLREKELVYPCFCSQEDLERERRLALASGVPPRYSGKCRGLPDHEIERRLREGDPCCWRFRVPEYKKVLVKDLVKGEKVFSSSNFGDFVVRRSDGSFLYLFTSSVDDGLMGIDCVIRGEDHLPNAPLQVMLMEAMGFSPPAFAHLPLMVDEGGKPYSKRHRPPSLRDLKREGYVPDAILFFLFCLGRREQPSVPLSLERMVEEFDLGLYGSSSCRFSRGFLEYCNTLYIREMDLDRLCLMFLEYCGVEDNGKVKDFLRLFRENANTLKDLCIFYRKVVVGEFEVPVFSPQEEELLSLFLKYEDPEKLIDMGFTRASVYRTLRRAVTGLKKGPPLNDVFSFLGEDVVVERVKRVLGVGDGYRASGYSFGR